jgi:hypothetical protein
MAKSDALAFLKQMASDGDMLALYAVRPLPSLVFHARCGGFAFSAAELAALIGAMEVRLITAVLGEAIDQSSSLWPAMWGRSRLDYVVKEVLARLPEADLHAIATEGAA